MKEEPQVKFGFAQVGKKTPDWAKWAFRIFFYTTSVVSLAIIMFTEIPVATALIISKVVTFANLVVHALSKLFGIDVSDMNYFDQQKKPPVL